jgi:hypothetical protein
MEVVVVLVVPTVEIVTVVLVNPSAEVVVVDPSNVVPDPSVTVSVVLEEVVVVELVRSSAPFVVNRAMLFAVVPFISVNEPPKMMRPSVWMATAFTPFPLNPVPR